MRNDKSVRENQLLNRRDFIRLAATGAGAVLLAACGGNTRQANTTGAKKTPIKMIYKNFPTEAATQSAGGTGGNGNTMAVPTSFKEAPALTKQVNAGKLPKVQDRLPKTPLMLKPVDKVGIYGGQMNKPVVQAPSFGQISNIVDFEFLVRWKPDAHNFTLDEVVPDIAESFEFNKQGTEYTFKLREGMKWSDGKPFTADDIMFWYEDVLMNKDLTPNFPTWLVTGDKSVVVEKQDDHTVVFKFAQPNGILLLNLARGRGSNSVQLPAHYMKQFHKKYNPKVVNEARKANQDNWTDLFWLKANYQGNSEKPTLDAWILTQSIGANSQQAVAERNPYYWKVDTEGNQLPYIDRLVFPVVEKIDVLLLKTLNGEADIVTAKLNVVQYKAVLYKNRQRGNYHFIQQLPDDPNRSAIHLNLTHQDSTKRQVFSNKDFRVGLSYAINRQEIIDTVYVSQGEPYQLAPRPQSRFYNEQLARQYTEHDSKKADEYLDKVLPQKDSAGFRLGPDGKRFSFLIEYPGVWRAEWNDVLPLVKRYWRKAGVDVQIKSEEQSLFNTRVTSNQHDAAVWYAAGGLATILWPSWYFPYNNQSLFAIPWAIWFQNPKAKGAAEPSDPAKQQMELYRRLEATADQGQQADLMKRILNIAQEQFWCMGINLPVRAFGVVKNRLHNVPESMVHGGVYHTPAPTNPPQYFIQK